MMKKQGKIKEPHYSPIKLMLEAKANSNFTHYGQFVPFSQERDGLGRLIKKQDDQGEPVSPLRKSNCSWGSKDFELKHNITPSTCISSSQRMNIVEEQIGRSF